MVVQQWGLETGRLVTGVIIGKHSTFADGCHVFKGSVEILEERTETNTIEDCGDLRSESIGVTHWVRFRVTGEPGSAFAPMSIKTRFIVHN